MPPKAHTPIKFPEDESLHDSVVEWWYFNGHLTDARGREYSFMDCFFRVDVKRVKIPFLSKIPFRISHFSHSLISDLGNKSFAHRVAPITLVSDDSFPNDHLYIGYINPSIRNSYTPCVIEKTGASSYRVKNEGLDLRMVSTKRPLLEGGDGFIDLGSKSTYYYSLTNLKTEGRIKVGDEWIAVTGKSWMDHQWADTSYSKDRWDWFSIQLDDDTEAICCMYDDGRNKTYFADISRADGSQEHYSEVEISHAEEYWMSQKSKATYPLAWNIRIPAAGLDLSLSARNLDQEVLFGSINYWEGPMRVDGTSAGEHVTGVGFAELVGYPSHYGSIRYLNDEIRKTVRQFISFSKNKAISSIDRPIP